jgi:hypothetical protein
MEFPFSELQIDGNNSILALDAVRLTSNSGKGNSLIFVGGVRERWVVARRGRGKTVCARGAWWALLGGPSISPLDGTYVRYRFR